MTSAIAMRDVALKMGDARLLHEVNLDLQAGETGVVIGETGSGKSSLLRLVLGLPGIQREDQVRIRGEVLVEGVSVFELSSGELQDLRRKIGLVKGDGGLIENMDVRRNVALPLAYHASAMRGDQIESRCEAVLADLGIADLAGPGGFYNYVANPLCVAVSNHQLHLRFGQHIHGYRLTAAALMDDASLGATANHRHRVQPHESALHQCFFHSGELFRADYRFNLFHVSSSYPSVRSRSRDTIYRLP